MENPNIYFVFNNFFPKIAPFMRQCRNIRWSWTGHWWKYNTARVLCMLGKWGSLQTNTQNM